MAFSSYCRGFSSLITTSTVIRFQIRSKHSITRAQSVSSDRALRQFVSSKGTSTTRNSAGRITIFHRGGGAKLLQRKIDLKRSTSSVGVVERLEYDPNRTSRIALVRWVDGAEVQVRCQSEVNKAEEFTPPHKILDPTMTTVKSQFSFSSLPGVVEPRKVACSGPTADHVVVGLPDGTVPGSKSSFTSKATRSKLTSTKDVFLSSKVKGGIASYSFVSSLGLPRIAVAGAKPAFFAPRTKEEFKRNESLCVNEIRRWDKDSIVWMHKIKRKAAVPWQSFTRQETLGLAGIAEHNESKLKPNVIDEERRDRKYKVDRAPVSYVIASHQMKPGTMVMNCDPSKRSNNELWHRY